MDNDGFYPMWLDIFEKYLGDDKILLLFVPV